MTEQYTLKVSERIDDRGNVARIRLATETGQPTPSFSAGAHLDIYLPEVGMWRQYSLCSDPAERNFCEIAVLKDPTSRGGSEAVHRLARPGATFQVEGPRNHFPLEETAELSVLVAGGIGVTPMLAMAKRLHALGRDFVLHYCTRSEALTAFIDDLRTCAFSDRVVFHFDDQPNAQMLDLARDLPQAADGTHLYVCGPQGFMDWVISGAEAAGHRNVHREYFSADIDATGDSFEVECAQSGVTLTIGESDTIAKALAKAGIDVEVKCEEGVCGTCITDVLSGEIIHHDKFLTDDERADGDQICVCCSRGRGKLVLDI